MVHGSIAIPGKTDRDEVVITTEEIADSRLDYLALGHWHSTQQAQAGAVAYAYAGAPEAVALDQDRAGKVLLVELENVDGKRIVTIEERIVGRTTFQQRPARRGGVGSAARAHREAWPSGPTPTSCSTSRIVGVRPDELDLDIDEIETALAASFLKVRVRDVSLPALTEGTLPSPDTVVGAFIRDLEARIAELEATDKADEAAELRDALRLGRLLLAGHEVSL